MNESVNIDIQTLLVYNSCTKVEKYPAELILLNNLRPTLGAFTQILQRQRLQGQAASTVSIVGLLAVLLAVMCSIEE